MSQIEAPVERSQPEPLPDNVRSVQPGGGVCYSLELAWGRLRRAWLRRFRRGYVARMAKLRRGSVEGAPHEVFDPRDLKFCRNLCTASWDADDDPFAWRDRLPFARWGLAELFLLSAPLAALTGAAACCPWPWLAVGPGVVWALVIWFFRDPPRTIPAGQGVVVSPADGRVVEITPLDYDDFIGGAAVRIGIFLSIFNVHINRAPASGRVIRLRYTPGKFLNALSPASARENERMTVGLEQDAAPHRRMLVHQITGQFARRIVCALRPGDQLARGEQFGMIKLGSRTELILPADDDLEIVTLIGQRVKAGSSVLAQFRDVASPPVDQRRTGSSS